MWHQRIIGTGDSLWIGENVHLRPYFMELQGLNSVYAICLYAEGDSILNNTFPRAQTGIHSLNSQNECHELQQVFIIY